MAMTSKERVYATMNFEPVDRPAVFPLEGSAWICMKHGMSYDDMFKLPDYGAQLLVDGFKEMNSDAIFVGGSAWMGWTQAFGSKIDASGVGAPIGVEPAFDDPATQIPELTDEEVREKLLDSYYVQCMLNQIKATKELVGDETPLMAGHDGPFTACGVLIGMQDFMLALGKREPWVPKLIDFAVQCLAVYADLLVDAGADIINCCDPVSSGDMISVMMFKKQVVPALAKYKEKKTNDAPILVHICGNAGARVEFIRDFGAKFFSVDSMVDLEEMVSKCDHKMVMVGNINPSDVMLQGTPEDVYNDAMRILEIGKANGGGTIPCTGCELPANSPLENIQSLARAAEDFAAR